LFPPEPDRPSRNNGPASRDQDRIEQGQYENEDQQKGLSEDLSRLRTLLTQEFGDTLSGTNALTAPLGVAFLVLAMLGWFSRHILSFLGTEELLANHAWVAYVFAAVLTLAALHLLFYWTVHRVSNAVKTRELDRVILRRRVNEPCRHLDCIEPEVDQDEPEENDAGKEESRLELALQWRCGLFDVRLEGFPLCAVCDRYEPREGASMII
jgi:hypothetical protein